MSAVWINTKTRVYRAEKISQVHDAVRTGSPLWVTNDGHGTWLNPAHIITYSEYEED